ncbi:Methylglyoxal synthase [Halomicronema hongdechloris C2206]|uniref:Methylglyoxal synthase n=1 Tax=Halomicronema hongdechloris C2206 TaxID=1641165 RepID=A0A1Z3HS69_9CYAN|nr:methylglyoxal synthase [Halomicronema hongdechloris]ASC73138.1 Methylglyoxal synthase [Halomicronema hongdechloris C2206]
MPTSVALIAHDGKKDDMVAFAQRFKAILSRYHVIATGTTGQRIQAEAALTVERMQSGPLGGDAQISARVVEGSVAAVVFLIDPLYAQPHEPDIQALLRICEVHNVPLATNLATAEAVLTQLNKARVGHLIFNPVAGQGNPDNDLALISRLLEPQIQLNVIYTDPDRDLTQQVQMALEQGTDLIIAAGGDGTVSVVAGGLAETTTPLGVIPRGTANAFAVALGIPTNLQDACATILAGSTRLIDVARCNGKAMVLLAGIGFEANMVERANRDLKARLGPLAYILAGMQQVGGVEPFQASVEMDNKSTEVTTGAITVANAAPPTSVLAQGFGQVMFDDGLLDVTISTSKSPLQSINALTSLFTSALVNTPSDHDEITRLRTRRIRIDTDPPQKVVVDGDIFGMTPVDIECISQGLTVLAPLSTIGDSLADD